MLKTRIRNFTFWPIAFLLSFLGMGLFNPRNAQAFTQLKNGFENITKTYLLPLSGAVAACALVLFITLSYFKKDEYQKNVGNILALAVFARVALSVIDAITRSFS
ncbi:MAG: hypothetical protein HYV97_18815 [Bdellovibrio sp.]|nr:hypothetical protein [Bdellovibrio sp.]